MNAPTPEQTAREREEARWRVFRLIQQIQAAEPGAGDMVRSIGEDAERRGWDEVARAAIFGGAVEVWFQGKDDLAGAFGNLIERSIEDGDPLLLAVGLAMRSEQGMIENDPVAAATGEVDLARAVVLVEQASDEPLEHITAHTACGIAFASRWLFELSDEQYAAALEVGASAPPGSLDFLLAPVAFNRIELQVGWAAMLRQLGEQEGARERSDAWPALAAAAQRYELPEVWQAELEAFGLLFGAITGQDVADEARSRLKSLASLPVNSPRPPGLLMLAAAIADFDAGRPLDSASVEAAVEAVDPSAYAQVYDLALFLAAEVEASTGSAAGLRYARRQLAQHWASRLSSLGAMRSRIEAERLSSERELLHRHANLDDLTGIGNRRALEGYLADLELRRVPTVALILIDVDAFKDINDQNGHIAGDAVLVGIARLLERNIRSSDLAVRLGGDEFAVVLADTDLESAHERARSFLAHVHEQGVGEAAPGVVVSLSAGVAAGAPASIAEMRAEADIALYRAKAAGGRSALPTEQWSGRASSA